MGGGTHGYPKKSAILDIFRLVLSIIKYYKPSSYWGCPIDGNPKMMYIYIYNPQVWPNPKLTSNARAKSHLPCSSWSSEGFWPRWTGCIWRWHGPTLWWSWSQKQCTAFTKGTSASSTHRQCIGSIICGILNYQRCWTGYLITKGGEQTLHAKQI